ncbi:MAG TPA: hypothetical protein VJZ70_02150 [Limnochordia bacterium]|nr:hypothetical protein [Limnochordia bacterium]
MSYLNQIQRSLDYVEDPTTEPLNVQDLRRLTTHSPCLRNSVYAIRRVARN